MASDEQFAADESLLKDVKSLLWGSSLKDDVFSRWAQGFIFSETTATALVQFEGGPCAVLAPVQAFIIKCALFSEGACGVDGLTSVSNERANTLLLEALFEILVQMNTSEDYVIVGLNQKSATEQKPQPSSNRVSEAGGETSIPQADNDNVVCNSSKHLSLCQEYFHSNLRCSRYQSKTDLHAALEKVLPDLQSNFGVLLYLYSILLTKGIHQIKNEVEDPSESLIDGMHGHGSQSLINLLLTSQATSNVWDNDKEISGLKLRGIQKQSVIGFLTLLEHMRYCEVGWFYKNPVFPIWLLGSETHLTILFSAEENLVVRDSPAMNAKHVFAQFDPEGNGFIATSLLEDILRALDLVAEKEYVDIMKSKLDSEELGIITCNSFMEEFFPEQQTVQPQSFTLYHYNGLPQSCPGGKVVYTEGKAVLAEEVDTQFITDTSPIKLCIQTKWPSIEVTWNSDVPPSLN